MTQLGPIMEQYVLIQSTANHLKTNSKTYITHVRANLMLSRSIQVYNLIIVSLGYCETLWRNLHSGQMVLDLLN